MKNVVIVIAIAFVVILLVALYYERQGVKQTSKERDELLDIAKKSSIAVADKIGEASKASADILVGLKDKISNKAEELLTSEEVIKFKEEFQEVINSVQSDVETKIDELSTPASV